MRYFKDPGTLRYYPEKCTGCGTCAEVCPHGIFTIENKKAVITGRELCIECGACSKNCAFGALAVDTGPGCAAAVINGILRGTDPVCGCSGESSGCC